jgi:hypothetical protein
MHLGAFTLTAIPLSLLDGYWSYDTDLPMGRDITFTHATVSQPDPHPARNVDLDSPELPGHALRLRLADVPKNDAELPYVLGLHAYDPAWHEGATDSSSATEIFVAAYDNIQNPKAKSLLSYRIQLTRTEKSPLRNPVALTTVENGTWRLSLIAQTRAPANKLPWNSRSISNAGTMFSLQDQLQCSALFSNLVQPANVLPLPEGIPRNADPLTVNVEPTSGLLTVGYDNIVKVLRLI